MIRQVTYRNQSSKHPFRLLREVMSLSEPTLYVASQHKHLLNQFAALHIHAIEQGDQLLRFRPPFTKGDEPDARVVAFWKQMFDEAESGSRLLLMQLASDGEHGEQRLAGCVMLVLPPAETGPFRAEVAVLIVHPDFRRRGIAKRMMVKLEDIGKERGRTLIVCRIACTDRVRGLRLTHDQFLDTMKGSNAEVFYQTLGYLRVGEIPRFGLHPTTGELVDEVFFYKDLRDD